MAMARHAVRREPLVGQPVHAAASVHGRRARWVDVADALLELGAFDREPRIAHPHAEQLLVRHRRPIEVSHHLELQKCRIAENCRK